MAHGAVTSITEDVKCIIMILINFSGYSNSRCHVHLLVRDTLVIATSAAAEEAGTAAKAVREKSVNTDEATGTHVVGTTV